MKQIIVFGTIVAIWEALSGNGLIDPFWIGQPSTVASRLWALFSSGEVYPHLVATLQATLIGFGIGLISGVIVGVLLGYFTGLSDIFDPIVMALYSLPRVALAPLFILYFGIGIASKVALAVTLAFFLVLINTRAGVRGVDRGLINAVKTMGGTESFILRRVVLPATIPWIIAGSRNGIIFSLMAVVVGEMLVARHGLGRLVTVSSSTFDTNGVFAVLVVMGTVSIVLNWVLSRVERRADRFSASVR